MHTRRRQRGQTIMIVAVSMVSLLAMAALAIDLTTLYVAKGEIQRAADTAALAGAKAFVDSGVTSNPGNTGLQAVAQQLANSYAAGAVLQNNVSGSSPQLVSAPTMDFSLQGNPRITVTLQKTSLPVFFARIFGTTAASVSATATAEAYNSAYSQSNTGTYLPAVPKCVKPFLVPNSYPGPDPSNPPNPPIRFVNEQTGLVTQPATFLGQTVDLASACTGNGIGQGCVLTPPNTPPAAGEYLPMFVSGPHTYCPNDAAPGCGGGTKSDFEQSTECCDGTAFDFKQCGASSTFATWDPTINPGHPTGPAQNGLQCLIHTTNTGIPSGTVQQDSLDPLNFMASTGAPQISPGTFSQGRLNIGGGAVMNTSDSIITVPLIHVPATMPANNQVTIVGFLQLFVNYVGGPGSGSGGPPAGDLNATILNVIGCGDTAASGAPVSGGGVSAIPVRLIHN
jgi:Flp pilus assembly protein TadG